MDVRVTEHNRNFDAFPLFCSIYHTYILFKYCARWDKDIFVFHNKRFRFWKSPIIIRTFFVLHVLKCATKNIRSGFHHVISTCRPLLYFAGNPFFRRLHLFQFSWFCLRIYFPSITYSTLLYHRFLLFPRSTIRIYIPRTLRQ